MTDDEIKAGLALCEAATAGPWQLDGRTVWTPTDDGNHNRFWAAVSGIAPRDVPVAELDATAAFIAAARTLLPEALRALQEERVVSERRRQERADALNVKTKDGLTSSEWILRTGKAERERDEALRELERLRRVERAARDCVEALGDSEHGPWVAKAIDALRDALEDA